MDLNAQKKKKSKNKATKYSKVHCIVSQKKKKKNNNNNKIKLLHLTWVRVIRNVEVL